MLITRDIAFLMVEKQAVMRNNPMKLNGGSCLCIATLLLSLWIAPEALRATDEVQDDAAKPSSAVGQEQAESDTGTDYDALVKQLDSDSFKLRRDASRKLSAAGKAAFPALKRAAQGESLEAANRAFDILTKHLESEDDPLKAEAQSVLEQIAESDNATAASQAKGILKPSSSAPLIPQVPQQIGQFRFSVSRKVVNGVKETNVQENGEKYRIVEDPNNGLTVEIAKQQNGKEVTEKFEAGNADELKKKSPKAHKIFDRYSRNPFGNRMQLGPGGRLPFGPGGQRKFLDQLRKQQLQRRAALGQLIPGATVSRRTINGVTEITAKENGETVKIVDDPNAGITVSITRQKDGKDVVETFEAADEKELKKKSPKAHKAFEKYFKQAPPQRFGPGNAKQLIEDLKKLQQQQIAPKN